MTALTDEQITQHLAELPGWSRDGDKLTKTFQFENYMAGVAFAAAVGTVSEGKNHHPDIHLLYRRVTVMYSTHDAGNKITAKDIEAAHAVEALGYPRTK